MPSLPLGTKLNAMAHAIDTREEFVTLLAQNPWNHADTRHCDGYLADVWMRLSEEDATYAPVSTHVWVQVKGLLTNIGSRCWALSDDLPEWAELIRVQVQLGGSA